MSELARAEVALEVDFDGLPEELRRGLEQHVRRAAKVAESELKRVEDAAKDTGDQVADIGSGAGRAAAQIKKAAQTADRDLGRVAEAARDVQGALFGLDGGRLVEVRQAAEDLQEALFDVGTVDLDRTESGIRRIGTASDRAGTSLRDRLTAGAGRARDALGRMGDRGQSVLTRLGQLGQRAGTLVGGAFTKARGSAASALSGLSIPTIVAAALAALNALPVAATAVGASIVGTLGSALVSVGLTASASSDRAKAEIASLVAFARSQARRLAAPFEATWTQIRLAAQDAFRGLEPFLQRAFSQLAPSVSSFARQLGTALVQLGPAIDGIANAFSAILADLGPRLPDIFAAIAQGITAITDAIAENPEQVTQLVLALAALVRIGGQVIAFLYEFGGQVIAAIPGLGALSQIIGALASSTESSATATTAAAAANTAAAGTYNGLSGEVFGLTGNVQGLSLAQQGAGVSATTQALSQQTLNQALRDGTVSGEEFLDTVESLVGANRAAATSQISLERAIDNAGAALRQNGSTLDINTEKGRRNSEALLAIAQTATDTIAALKDQGAAQSRVNAVADRASTTIQNLATKMGASKGEARQLADQILGVGKQVKGLKDRKITITAVTSPAKAAVDALVRDINSRTASVTVTARPGGATGGLVTPRAIVPGYADGGRVRGPGGPRADRVHTMLSAGEYVINARQTRRHLGLIQAINSGAMGFASGGLVPGYAAGGRVGGQDAKTGVVIGIRLAAGLAKTLRNRLLAIGERIGRDFQRSLLGSPSEINSAVRQLTRQIQTAFRGVRTRTDDRLVAALTASNRRLQVLARERDRIIARMQEATQFRQRVSDQLTDFASVTGLQPPEGQKTSVDTLTKGLQDRLKALRDFRANIDRLLARGLDKGIIRDLLEAGPETSGPIAAQLSGASQAAIRRINAIQQQIAEQAKRLSRNATDALFDAGRAAGKGFLTGLKEQEDDIKAIMRRIAKTVTQTIKKELRISSPSRVLRADGANAGRGFAVGLESQLAEIQRIAGRYSSALTGTTGSTAARQTVRTNNVNNTYVINQASDPRAVAAAIEGRLVAALR